LAVNVALVSIAVTPSAQSVPVSGTQPFTATGAFNDASHKDITGSVTWSSSDTSIATGSGAGLATGVAAGSASIRGHVGERERINHVNHYLHFGFYHGHGSGFGH
jgi:uncharacterized protein YjdB